MWTALARAADLVAPEVCAGCGAENERVCASCAASLTGRIRFLSLAADAARPPIPVSFVVEFQGPAGRMLRALKDGDRPALARHLAPALARSIAVHSICAADSLVVPVPASLSGRKRRGYDHVEIMLRQVAKRQGRAVEIARDAVLRTRIARDQRELGAVARWQNASAGWQATGQVRGREVLLVDDVVTTGASLAGVARAIESAGGRVRGCAVIAATRLRRTSAEERAAGAPAPEATDLGIFSAPARASGIE